MATSTPVKNLLSSDDVLPAEGVQAAVDSVNTAIDVHDEQHKVSSSNLAGIHDGPQFLVAIAVLDFSSGFKTLPTLNPASIGVSAFTWLKNNPTFFNAFRIDLDYGRICTGAKAFVRYTGDTTAGAGVLKTEKLDIINPAAYAGDVIGNPYSAVFAFGAIQGTLLEMTRVTLRMFGRWDK